MTILLVANSSKDWPAQIENVQVVDARSYLADPGYSELRGVKVFNLCRSYRYQSTGYYVSLLAEARGHKPLPSITTMQDLKSRAIAKLVSEELDELIQTSLTQIKSDKFTLSIYFGRNLARRYDRLALNLFNQFPLPLLRAQFSRTEHGWELRRIASISANEVPESHWPFVIEVAGEHFAGRRGGTKKRNRTRFDLAILHNPADPEPPSDAKALQKFGKAASSLGISTEMITRDDYGRLAEFDALFIRDTTYVNSYTYRFSRRAAGEGLVVIDDPESIVRCTNKVYLSELLTRHKVPIPKTMVVHRDNACTIPAELGFPCVLKKPDSAFSQGVVKVADEAELSVKLAEFLADSDLLIAQEFLPTTFDWRICVIDRQPLCACKYFMAQGHWQIIRHDRQGPGRYGKSETVPVELAPRRAVQAALKAANLIGDGLYGVDVKQSNGKFYVIEVNDNPNIDSGCEDAILKDDLYRRIMGVFLKRIELRKAGWPDMEGAMSDEPLHLFEAYGVELEYMIVDAESLSVRPMSDVVLHQVAGEYLSEIEMGEISWSNELALHVIELKITDPAPSLEPLADLFQQHVRKINDLLQPLGARLMPTAMHPWMNPDSEMKLWPHEYNAVYSAYNRIFDCRGHGWANLQSVHVNLPFADDAEFGKLHAAIRLLMPILPALAASSPVIGGKITGVADNRMDVYRHNSRSIPSLAGEIIPEPVFTQADYEQHIFAKMYADIAPHDDDGILQHEWLNARGAIARFERNTIEIRVLDVQECPAADLAICKAVAAVLQALIDERWTSLAEQQSLAVAPLASIFLNTVRDADATKIADRKYLQQFGFTGERCTAQELWRHLVRETNTANLPPLTTILEQGPLSRRITRALGNDLQNNLAPVYRRLCDCLAEGKLFA